MGFFNENAAPLTYFSMLKLSVALNSSFGMALSFDNAILTRWFKYTLT